MNTTEAKPRKPRRNPPKVVAAKKSTVAEIRSIVAKYRRVVASGTKMSLADMDEMSAEIVACLSD